MMIINYIDIKKLGKHILNDKAAKMFDYRMLFIIY